MTIIPNDNQYGTHFIPLTFAMLYTNGPILEMGAGHYSTPLLHLMSEKLNRKLYTADTSRNWLEEFTEFENELHEFHYVPVYDDDWSLNPRPNMWDKFLDIENGWGVVFIDHRPGDRRKVDVANYAQKTQIVVVHDTEESSYDYESAFSMYKYRKDYKRFETCTTLLSNYFDFDNYKF